MKLKKLTIVGFKSFADRVALDFDCEIIGVVGPNGCGKSNIVDAFRWVIGEQSAKSLRGDKMHDVLFAGTDKRKGSNYAEVSVLLTDIDGHLPLPYDEMTITRRLHRSGESEYFINKESVRLKDIHTLLLGSGIGKNAFSIFEQGKLDQIIHFGPLERRIIFDEAAGTSRFLQRKKETLRKLETVTENYARVHDVHKEIEKQALQLKRQAGHAKSYQENKQKLEDLEKSILLFRLHNLMGQSASLENELAILKQEMAAQDENIAGLDRELTQLKDAVQAEELHVKQLHKELNLCETKARVLEAEIGQQKYRLFEAKKREENSKTQIEEIGKQQESLSQEKQQKSSQLQAAVQKRDQKREEFEQKKKIHSGADQEVIALREGIKKLQAGHLKLLQEEGRLRTELQEKTFRYEARLARLQILHALEKTHAGASLALNGQIDVQSGKVEALSAQIDLCKHDLMDVEKVLNTIRAELAEANQEERVLVKHVTEAESHQKALKRLQEDMEGFSPAAKMLLKEAKSEKSHLLGKVEPLFAYLVPQKGYEELLASAMRPYAETLLVANEEDLHLLLDYAKNKKISDFSVVIQSRFKTAVEAKRDGSLAEHMEKNALAYHFTQGYTLAPEGDFYDALGVFFHPGQGKKLSNPFQRQAELKALAETISHLHLRLEQQRTKQMALQERMKTAEHARAECGELHRKKEMDLIQENFKLQQILADLEKLKREIASVTKETHDLGKLHDAESEIEALKEKLSRVAEELSCLSRNLHAQEALLDSSQNALKAQGELVSAADALYREAQTEWQNKQQEIQIIDVKCQKNETDEKRLIQEIAHIQAATETLLSTIATQERDLHMSSNSLKELQKALTARENTLVEVKKQADLSDKAIAYKRKETATVSKKCHEVELALAAQSSEKKSVEAELLERHQLTPDACKGPIALEIPLEEAMQEVLRLRSLLEGAGGVNMTAIDEFKQTQERFDYLDKQLKDLHEAKADLEKVIVTLDGESRKIFKATFQRIRENFQKNFSILFTGGSADLTFTESADVLEAGIEIVARPPGKQMRSISLLSGGEKCLTALALLFSIFEVRPAPFCILDEVDAPLDDSNIERFTTMLKQFIDKTQFIIVTHNKKTMSIADLLIGVSMEEKGVSKLISFAFEQTKRTAAIL